MSKAKAITLHLEYAISLGNTDCSGALFEIPTTEIIGGDVIDIRIWGMDFNMLAPYALNRGTTSMGAGINTVMPLDDIIEYPQFGNETSSRTKWVISNIIEIKAIGIIYYDNDGAEDLWADDGEIITNRFSSTDNIITTFDNVHITGTVQIKYRSTQDVQELIEFAETHEYQAKWPIHAIGRIVAVNEILKINKADGSVETWATDGEDVTSKFVRKGYSCIIVGDGTDLYGTVRFEFTRSPYYKLWQWTVPTNGQGTYWFFIYRDGSPINKFAIELPDLTDGMPEPRNIALRVVARDGGASLDEASVYIDGLYMGITDENGILNIDGIMTGTHDLRVTRAGFVDTDQDDLWNDKLEVY
jgi:hypothetical protein